MYIIFHQKKSTHIWISPNSSRLCSISIIIFLFSFQALRQTRQQRRHLRISQNLHQKVRIHTFRNSHRVCCLTSICTLHLRIKIFPVIKRILHPLCILLPVLVKRMHRGSTCSYASFSAIIVSHDTESKKLST